MGLSIFFKNFAPVFMIAFVFYYILFFCKKNCTRVLIFSKVISVILIFSGYLLSKSVGYAIVDNIIGVDVSRNVTPCYLNVGLRGSGKNDRPESYGVYFDKLRENNYDYKKTNDETINELIYDLRLSENDTLTYNFFKNKAEVLFGNDSARMYWVKETLNSDRGKAIIDAVKNFNNYYFAICVFLMWFPLIIMNRDKNLFMFLLYLIFFGCFLLLILVEAQNRYMYSIQTFMCILAGYGVGLLAKEISLLSKYFLKH